MRLKAGKKSYRTILFSRLTEVRVIAQRISYLVQQISHSEYELLTKEFGKIYGVPAYCTWRPDYKNGKTESGVLIFLPAPAKGWKCEVIGLVEIVT